MAKLWKKPPRVSSWRKISVGMWNRPSDPTIYGFETVDIDDLVSYLAEVSQASGVKVSLTAYLVKAFSDVIAEHPELNTIIVGNRVMQREHIDAFCQVSVANDSGGSADLSGVKLRDSETMDFVQIAQRLHGRAEKVRLGQDKEIEQTKSLVDKIPPLLLPSVLKLVDFLTYAVPINFGKIGIRDDPFGSFMVTNCAPFDIKLGFAPLVPAARTPLVALPGKIEDHVFPVDGKPVVRKGVQIGFTADHRCFDGLQIGFVVRGVRARLNHPREYYPAPESFAGRGEDRDEEASDASEKPARNRTPESHVA
jgi:pyruvate/2-oxoglutarate dehydrogenase complex dihydrolipoamide acyltransferase (E2) component